MLVLPQVTVSEAVPGIVNVDGVDTEFEYTVPFSALEWLGEDYYVYYVQETSGKFGREDSVVQLPVNVVAQDGITSVLKSQGYGSMVVASNKPLELDMRVMIR